MIAIAIYAAAVTAAVVWLACARAREREALARAAHELRGPLQAIAIGLVPGAGPDRQRTVELELARARLALDDLTGTRRGLPLERVQARSLLADAACAAVARGAAVSTEWIGPEATVWCEPVRIAQALVNLVVNALEHGAGPVVVRGRLTGTVARFEVCDDGAGLPAPVATLTRPARAGRGRRGRGLAIAAEIAAAHGGRLAAAPSRRGARLVLEVPVTPPQRFARRVPG